MKEFLKRAVKTIRDFFKKYESHLTIASGMAVVVMPCKYESFIGRTVVKSLVFAIISNGIDRLAHGDERTEEQNDKQDTDVATLGVSLVGYVVSGAIYNSHPVISITLMVFTTIFLSFT